jgi:hypothetical protein
MAPRPLGGDAIRALVEEVADRLAPEGPQHVVILVGGSLLAWQGLRDSTEDVDSIQRFDEEVRAMVAAVALDHDLEPDWLNANAAMFTPATFDPDGCATLLDRPRLLVLGAPMRDLFLMKLHRSDPNDVADMIVIWPTAGFTTARQVVDAYYRAYPLAPSDEFLGEYVMDIAARAGVDLPPG